MGKYKAYPEYRESGVEWIGEIPAHWEISRVKYSSPFHVGWTPSTRIDSNFIGDNLWVNISDLKQKIITETVKRVSDKAILDSGIKLTKKGSLMYSFKLSVGAVSFAGVDMYTNEAIASFPPNRKLPLSFLYYALPVYVIQNKSTNIYGASILNQELIRNADLPKVSFDEAMTIAKFLDHETAKIDTLIGKQERLIELLQEKRQAVISHAVTKGLDGAVGMKDSGVEWLGEVPEHWEVAQLKFSTKLIQTGPFGSLLHAHDYVEGGIPLINPAHMESGRIIPDPRVAVDIKTQERLNRFKLKKGDIIFARRGDLGRCAVVREENEGWICGTGSLKVTLKESLLSDYAYLLFTSDGFITELSLESKGSTMDNLNTEILGGVRVSLPSLIEQEEILKFVQQVFRKYERLVDLAQKKTLLLQERRTALISAAVTGKIDVRDVELS